ncbi:MAG: right-handed parallel beta-helix repeat-containing protein [Planctomycetes bacterium]|nr:right-handed parallel beta-helix repeat-containing protein [Planctomycetota bacterium]
MKTLATLLSLLLLQVPVFAHTLIVPDDYGIIQEAIDAAQDGDTVCVKPGVYVENIDFSGKAITVKSCAGPYATIIDAGDPIDPLLGSAVVFMNGEGKNSMLIGFTLTHGTGSYVQLYPGYSYSGGGIYLKKACPVIKNCIFRDNQAREGGGVLINDAEPELIDCIFLNNFAEDNGGAIYAVYCSTDLKITNGLFVGNESLNGGGALYCDQAAPVVTNCTFFKNRALGTAYYSGGGGFYAHHCAAIFRNCIFWMNEAYQGAQIMARVGNSSEILDIDFCDVQGGFDGVHIENHSVKWGKNNLDADPLFVDPDLGHFYLQQTDCQIAHSPCVDAGAGDMYGTTRTDGQADGDPADMGYHPLSGLSLYADAYTLNAATGGEVHFILMAGAENKCRLYVLLGSLSGTAPGTPLPDGETVLPINWDHFSCLTLMLGNLPLFDRFKCWLDSEGTGTAALDLPPVPCLVDATMSFAYVLIFPCNFASNAVNIHFAL